jgi:hypothetical protein
MRLENNHRPHPAALDGRQEDELGVLGPQDLRHRTRVIGLVKLFLAKADGEHLDWPFVADRITTTRDESIPPERNAPIGTSDTIFRRTVSSSSASSSSTM